tara:strand:- start:91 stop:669 length:579 start_codon:yes stop_codon:yes gene_type:complete
MDANMLTTATFLGKAVHAHPDVRANRAERAKAEKLNAPYTSTTPGRGYGLFVPGRDQRHTGYAPKLIPLCDVVTDCLTITRPPAHPPTDAEFIELCRVYNHDVAGTAHDAGPWFGGLRGAHLVFNHAVEIVRKARVIAARKKAAERPWAVPSDQLPPVVWPAKTATSIRVDSHGNKINHLGQKVGYDGVLLE